MVFLLSLIVGLGLLAGALLLLSPLAPTAVDIEGIGLELQIDQQDLKPEPLERFLYVAGVLLLPFCLGGAYLGVRRIQRTRRGRCLIGCLASPAAWLMAPLLFLLLFSTGFADNRAIVRSLIPGGTISLVAAVVLALGATAATGSRFREPMNRLLRVLLPSLAGVLLLGVLLFNILGPEHVRNIPIFWASFNAVFHSVVQVFFGKELLVDFVNQYGLYPHFIEPVFRLTGLSVYTFTILMGLLNCLAFACIYRFLAAETADELLPFLGLTTILFFGYVAGRVVEQDLFLQYHPLRILFPALSLLIVQAFAHGPTSRLVVLLFALGAAAALWNPDSGVIVLAAGFLVVVYDALLRRRPREIPARLLSGAAAATVVVAAFSCLLRLRYGSFPDYTRLFQYSQGFYLSGAHMFPMPRFGLWVPVLAVYAAGLLSSLAAMVEGEDTPRARLLFYLSVFGLGIFTYYQGRSTLGNLLAAGYPAVLLFVLFVDDHRRNTPAQACAADRLLSVTLLALLLFSVSALAAVAPDWIRAINEKIRVTISGEESEVLKDAKFLRNHVRPGQQILIRSFNSGVHHLLTQTTNPLDTPGQAEILYRSDFKKRNDYTANRRGAFVIDKNTVPERIVDIFRRDYPDFHENPDGTLIVFPAP